jgi:biotin carboxylase
MIWFLEGQASQRDVIIGARDALQGRSIIVASHQADRPEITGQADISLTEPSDPQERLEWVIETALERSINVVVAGRLGGAYEAHRARFEDAGLVLVTGGASSQTFDLVDDKSAFTAEAERAGLACVPAITVTNPVELSNAYEVLVAAGEVCIKPVVGIYGQGFWRFKEVDPFRCLANPDARQISFDAYFNLYSSGPDRPAMLVMPYMPGSECSVDMVCEDGRVIEYVGRRKQNAHQTFERNSAAVQLALRAAEHFGCDGIVNVQTRDDADGVPRLLEINPRYSGGIGYTRATGINLPGIFATRRLGQPEPAFAWNAGVRVKPITVAAAIAA